MTDYTIPYLSMKEFNAIERNEDGRILYLGEVFELLAPEMVELLVEDDRYYYNELMDELNYELGVLGA